MYGNVFIFKKVTKYEARVDLKKSHWEHTIRLITFRSIKVKKLVGSNIHASNFTDEYPRSKQYYVWTLPNCLLLVSVYCSSVTISLFQTLTIILTIFHNVKLWCHALHYDELFGIPVDFPRIFGSTQFQAIVLDWPLEITPLVSVEVFKLYVHSKLSRKKQHDLFLVVFVQFGMYIYEMHFYDCFLICSKFSCIIIVMIIIIIIKIIWENQQFHHFLCATSFETDQKYNSWAHNSMPYASVNTRFRFLFVVICVSLCVCLCVFS